MRSKNLGFFISRWMTSGCNRLSYGQAEEWNGQGRLPEVEDFANHAGSKKMKFISLRWDWPPIWQTEYSRPIFWGRTPGISIWENDGSGIPTWCGIKKDWAPNRFLGITSECGLTTSLRPDGLPRGHIFTPQWSVEKHEFIRGAFLFNNMGHSSGIIDFLYCVSQIHPLEF